MQHGIWHAAGDSGFGSTRVAVTRKEPAGILDQDYASPTCIIRIMLLKIAIMLLSMQEISLLFYTSLANQFRSYKLRWY
jgi:hypothetical protein